jgi:hypothetical protein
VATFASEERTLRAQIRSLRLRLLAFTVLAAAGAALCLFSLLRLLAAGPSAWWAALALSVLGAAGGSGAAAGARRSLDVLSAGAAGEAATRAVLSRLDDRFTVFCDLWVAARQLDHVVVGPTGVFIIETKNLKGSIEGATHGREIVQRKTGRGGSRYARLHPSPIAQLRTHVHHLEAALRREGLHTRVQGAVYFAHPSARIALEGSDVPVFAAGDGGAARMLEWIARGDASLPKVQQDLALRLLKSAAARRDAR